MTRTTSNHSLHKSALTEGFFSHQRHQITCHILLPTPRIYDYWWRVINKLLVLEEIKIGKPSARRVEKGYPAGMFIHHLRQHNNGTIVVFIHPNTIPRPCPPKVVFLYPSWTSL